MREREHEEEAAVQLATRIPKSLHQAIKVYCVRTEQSIMDFVASSLKDKLGRARRK